MNIEASQHDGLAEAWARKGSFLNDRPLRPCKGETNIHHQPAEGVLVTANGTFAVLLFTSHSSAASWSKLER
jgi:hypothetical protein